MLTAAWALLAFVIPEDYQWYCATFVVAWGVISGVSTGLFWSGLIHIHYRRKLKEALRDQAT